MITRVKLVNWKSHKETELQFSKGVNALIGIMGSGKTSVMQGIAFALFGTFSLLQSKKLRLDDLLMKKPVEASEALVELEFVINGKTYTIRRKLTKGKGTTEAEIREDGKLIEVSPAGVTREVERILQMDYDLFQRAVYSEQNALDYFLQIPKGKRMDKIDSMLKLDLYEKARENAVKLRGRIIERRNEKMRVIEELKNRDIEKRMKQLESEISQKKTEMDRLSKEKTDIEKKAVELTEILEKHESVKREYNELLKKMESLNSRIFEIERYLQMKKDVEKIQVNEGMLTRLSDKIKEIDDTVNRMENELKNARESLSKAKGRLDFILQQINDYENRINEMKSRETEINKLHELLGSEPEEKLKNFQDTIDDIKKKVYALETKREELEKTLGELKTAGNKCPVCESPLSEERKKNILEEKNSNLRKLNQELKIMKKSLENREEEFRIFKENYEKYKELADSLKDYKEITEKTTELKNEKNSLEKTVTEIENSLKSKEVELSALRKKLQEKIIEKQKMSDLLRKKEELEELKKEKEDIVREKSELEEQKKAYEHSLSKIDEAGTRKERDKVIGRLKAIETSLKHIAELINEKLKSLEELSKDMETFTKYKEDIKNYGKIIEWVDKFIKILKITQNQLRDEFLKTVNHIMNFIWPELYPYGDFKEIKMLVDNDYILQLKTSRGWVNVESVSGGERTIACLALRIAFSLAFTPNLRWLILDEPTHNMDSNAIRHFGEILKNKMENLVEQVFLITHEEALSDYINGCIYRLEREKDKDGITKLVKL
ncbi:MAG: SMC family ATPase [Candidatus Aenigmarchaeota archaeon]|nr:SMC family ATPase [Candidatus Aenigmarchaeota archaeon]